MANGEPMSVDEILAIHAKSKERLAALSNNAGDRLDALRRKQPRAPADEDEIARLRQEQRDISNELAELARHTAEMFEDSAELSEMIESLKGIVSELRAKRAELSRLDSAAGTVAEVIAGIETVVQEAAKHLPS